MPTATRLTRPRAAAPTASTSPETELLLCTARTRPDAATTGRAQALMRRELNWEHLRRVADHHGLAPLLYWNLSRTCPEAVPEATLDRLQADFRLNATRAFILSAELSRLLALFETHGIPALPFKGPTLAALAYDQLMLRRAGDLDIMVHPQHVPRAKELLLSQGYCAQIPRTAAAEAAHRRAECHDAFVSTLGRALVELHWRFTPRCFPFALDLEQLWEHRQPLSLGGTTVPSLAPEELILVLAVHGAKHSWERLNWICDVAELIRAHPRMDWGRVLRGAHSLHSERILFLGLRLARDLLGAPLPQEIEQHMVADRAAASLAVQAHERLFEEAGSLSDTFRAYLFPLWTMQRLRDRTRYGLFLAHRWTAPNHRDHAFLSLPAALSFLYYPLRPLRLIVTRGQRPDSL